MDGIITVTLIGTDQIMGWDGIRGMAQVGDIMDTDGIHGTVQTGVTTVMDGIIIIMEIIIQTTLMSITTA